MPKNKTLLCTELESCLFHRITEAQIQALYTDMLTVTTKHNSLPSVPGIPGFPPHIVHGFH